jgi:hypothetical protein
MAILKGDTMSNSFAKAMFPILYGKVERKKNNARSRVLSMTEINTLLSMRFNNVPTYTSIEDFYTEEYKEAMKNKAPAEELEKIEHFRKATEQELNLIYSDIHSREDKIEMGGANSQE